MYSASVFDEFGVCVVLDWVALGSLGLRCGADVDGDASAVEDRVGDDAARS